MAAAALRPGHVIRARGESWVVHRHVTGALGSVIDVRGHGTSNRGIQTSFLLPYEPIELLPSSEAPRIVRPRTWRRVARSILSSATPSYDGLRAPARAGLTVLPFQLEPVLAVVGGLSARILIADEVGLGKTIQAGLIISEWLERRPDARILVVTPAGLRDQWHTELRARFDRNAVLIDSASITHHAAHWNGNPWSVPGVILTSLDYVKRPEVVRALESLIWDVVVFDEAHTLAGRSDRATVASLLARRARALVLLTATPHSGDDEAFGRLTTLGDFSSQFPLLVFRRTRTDIGMSSARRTLSLRVRPTKRESDMHRALMAYARLVWKQTSPTAPAARLAMTMLTRRACSSPWSLARSLETRLRLLATDDRPDVLQMALPFGDATSDDDAPGSDLSSPGLSDRDEERRWLEHVLQLSRLAEPGQSKILALRRLLRRAREPAIVFTEYRDTLQQLAHHLDDFFPVELHGGMTGVERHEVVRRFVNGEARLLLATDAASEGLNLHQRCRLVINLELPWTPVRLEQRVGRVERLGQERRVHAVHLLAADTCEEASVAVLLSRMRHVAGVLGGMRAAAYEQQIGEAAIGNRRVETGPAATSLPSGLVIGNLRTTAIEEAARLELARRLRTAPRDRFYEHEAGDSRPCVTVRKRRADSINQWCYRLVFEDSALQPLWATVIGIRVDGRPEGPARRAIRHYIESLAPHLDSALTPLTERLLSSLLPLLNQTKSLASERERAIADGLRQQRARLATSLLQPGLFDRRAERAAAAQNATLDEALERCTHRLAELSQCDSISVDRRLVLGLVFR